MLKYENKMPKKENKIKIGKNPQREQRKKNRLLSYHIENHFIVPESNPL